jgi:hypothetical protein
MMQNRWRLMARKVNEASSLAQRCSNWKKSHFAIDDLALNSHDPWSFWHQFSKTVGPQGWWKMNPRRISKNDEELMKF